MLSYRDRLKFNPTWPKLARDWEGRLVKPNEDIETRAGVLFKAGETLRVLGVYRGRLELVDPNEDHLDLYNRRTISAVWMIDVELLPEEG